MYIALETVVASIEQLRRFHPFFGMDFLVAKKGNLSVGKEMHFRFDEAVKQFSQTFYKPDFASAHYFHPFRTTSRAGGWVSPKYPSSGSQSTRTKSDFAAAFLHRKDTDAWGWVRNYLEVLRSKLDRDKSGQIPAFWLAVWLFREREWPGEATPEAILETFVKEFSITKEERRALFTTPIPERVGPVFTDQVYSDAELLKYLKPAPDTKPEEGGTLRLLDLEGIGPTPRLHFVPGERLSIITGDNGLGKTFLLECAWWSLTGQWAEQQAAPRLDSRRGEPAITFEIAGKRSLAQKTRIKFDWTSQSWPAPRGRPTLPGLIVYGRVDGSFAVWDPVRHAAAEGTKPGMLLFRRDDVFYGLPGQIEGLIRDWVAWQRNPDQSQFEVFKRVLLRLSPPDLGPLVPDEPTRLPFKPGEVPTIRHHFGVVPITQESAGVKRVVTLAYLLVWAWNEHRVHSNLARKPPQKKIVVLIDEMEAHLHPKWQRIALPALLDVAKILSKDVQPQLIVATHSPLVLASLEASFDEQTDKLYHLQLRSGHVSFRDTRFVKHGRVDEWLTSEIFEMAEPRSREGEHAMQQARELLAADHPSPEAIRAVTVALKRALAEDDELWPRWLYFAEQKGVEL